MLSLCFVNIINSASAQTNPAAIKKEKFNESKDIEDEIGYTHAVKVDNVLYISGTVGSGDVPAQIKSIMESIKATLAKHGASFQNVVKETVYATDLDAFIQNKDIRKKYYGNDFPAATWVEVKRLYLPEFKVEIEVIAHLPKK